MIKSGLKYLTNTFLNYEIHVSEAGFYAKILIYSINRMTLLLKNSILQEGCVMASCAHFAPEINYQLRNLLIS